MAENGQQEPLEEILVPSPTSKILTQKYSPWGTVRLGKGAPRLLAPN